MQRLCHRARGPGAVTAFARRGRRAQTARLLALRDATPIVKVTLGSFDPHTRPRGPPARLRGESAAGLAALRNTLRRSGQWSQVRMLT